MARSLVWVPVGMSGLFNGLPDDLEIMEIPEDVKGNDRFNDVEMIIVRFGPNPVKSFFKSMPKLKVVQTTTAGVDSLFEFMPNHVLLCSSRGAYQVVAEWVVAGILADYKSLPQCRDAQNDGRWGEKRVARRLVGSTILFVGYGGIAERSEELLKPFGVEFLRVARSPRPGVGTLQDLSELLPSADIVVLLVPLTSETTGLVDQKFLSQMKEGSLLVNAARGAVVDTDALIDAAQNNHVRAVLDVTDPEPLPNNHPLFSTPNVFITPHIAGGTNAREEVIPFLRSQLERFAKDETLKNIVVNGY